MWRRNARLRHRVGDHGQLYCRVFGPFTAWRVPLSGSISSIIAQALYNGKRIQSMCICRSPLVLVLLFSSKTSHIRLCWSFVWDCFMSTTYASPVLAGPEFDDFPPHKQRAVRMTCISRQPRVLNTLHLGTLTWHPNFEERPKTVESYLKLKGHLSVLSNSEMKMSLMVWIPARKSNYIYVGQAGLIFKSVVHKVLSQCTEH